MTLSLPSLYKDMKIDFWMKSAMTLSFSKAYMTSLKGSLLNLMK